MTSQGNLLGSRYQVIQTLGKGGMSQTFIAEDIHRPGNPTCVVKQLQLINFDPQLLSTARNLFKREAKTLEELGNHPQIPHLLAHFEENQEFYLVQQFIEGQTLNTTMQSGQRWSEQQVIQLLLEVLNVLQFIHSKGVIHRDIKPSNLIQQPDGKLVLIDFGAVQEMKTQLTTSISAQTKVVIGTPGYMPIEQLQGKPRPSSDIYALGMVAIQALTGRMPTELSKDPTGEILWQDFAEVNKKLAAVLTKMVRYDFHNRYQTAAEALQAVQQLADEYRQTIPFPKLSKKTKNIMVALGATLTASTISASLWGKAQIQTGFGGDGVLDVVVLTTPENPKENYVSLVKHLKSKLSSTGKVKIHSIDVEEKNAKEKVRQQIIAKKADLVFTTRPLLSAAAVENEFEFAARMFPNVPHYQSALFVKNSSPIETVNDLNLFTTIGLGSFNSAALFYAPVYDLYGKKLQLDLNNSSHDIMHKVESGQVDIGSGAYEIVKQHPEFRIISVSRAIPPSGVYLSSKLDYLEQNLVKQALLNAPDKIKKQAKYGEGKEIYYTHFMKIVERVQQITGCTNWEQNPVELFCQDDSTPSQESTDNVIIGKVNGFKMPYHNTVHLNLQSNDGIVYCLVLSMEILNQEANLPPLPAWNGKTIQVIGEPKQSPTFGTMELKITEPGKIQILR